MIDDFIAGFIAALDKVEADLPIKNELNREYIRALKEEAEASRHRSARGGRMGYKYRITWTKGQGYRPYLVLRETWGFEVGDWVDITMFGTDDRPELTQTLRAEMGKGNVVSPIISIPRTWFRAISDRETVTFEVAMNTPAADADTDAPNPADGMIV